MWLLSITNSVQTTDSHSRNVALEYKNKCVENEDFQFKSQTDLANIQNSATKLGTKCEVDMKCNFL